MTSSEVSAGRLPTAEDEARFWALIEAAWQRLGRKVNKARAALATRKPDPEVEYDDVDEALDDFIEALSAECRELSATELTDLDRVLERKLYDIDRADIQEVTDGSDDGFLYARGFIVALGRDFYAAVLRDPRMALLDAECEEMCYFFAHLHDERFGDFPGTGSGISRESGANRAGWPD